MSTEERATKNRAATIAALTATLTSGLDADEAAANAGASRVGMPWRAEPQPGTPGGLVIDELGLVGTTGGRYAADHIARHDPARILREVRAKRDLIAAIVAEPHDWVAGDEFYSCSQAVDYAGLNHESREPGSACTDPDRAGKPCDCGRDARVERLLRILAGAYEEGGR